MLEECIEVQGERKNEIGQELANFVGHDSTYFGLPLLKGLIQPLTSHMQGEGG